MSTKAQNKKKETLINQNISLCRAGVYQNCPTGNCLKSYYNKNFDSGEIMTNVCQVFVYNAHAIDILSDFCLVGFKAGLKDNLNPVTVCTVGEEFAGSNYPQSEEIRDDIFNVRTNYNMITLRNNPFPLNETECTYNQYLTVMRDQNLSMLTPQNSYRFAIITASPIKKPNLLDENRMNSENFIKMLAKIEAIFQTAILGNHNVLVLTPFGHREDDVPQEDIVKLYNYCIYKYGHKFLRIIIGVPTWDGEYLFNLFNEGIVRPQNLSNESESDNNKKVLRKKKKNNYSATEDNLNMFS